MLPRAPRSVPTARFFMVRSSAPFFARRLTYRGRDSANPHNTLQNIVDSPVDDATSGMAVAGYSMLCGILVTVLRDSSCGRDLWEHDAPALLWGEGRLI